MNRIQSALLIAALGTSNVEAAIMNATIYSADTSVRPLGQITWQDTEYGLLITPNLANLPPGLHGFHLHQHPNCAAHGMNAGDHFDPSGSKSHKGPYASGHLGDLPVLYVGMDGTATTPVLAPRLTTKDIHSLAAMIHEAGDNYTDNPKSGGGGNRIACGIIGD